MNSKKLLAKYNIIDDETKNDCETILVKLGNCCTSMLNIKVFPVFNTLLIGILSRIKTIIDNLHYLAKDFSEIKNLSI